MEKLILMDKYTKCKVYYLTLWKQKCIAEKKKEIKNILKLTGNNTSITLFNDNWKKKLAHQKVFAYA